MKFHSKELINATNTSSSITYVEPNIFDIENLRNLLRTFIVSKDSNLLKIYDLATLNKRICIDGIENLELLINILRQNYIISFKEDNERQAIINLMFDNIISSLKTLKIININSSANEINTIILGFLIKNFI